jgi:hypothetical protein
VNVDADLVVEPLLLPSVAFERSTSVEVSMSML